MLPNDPEALTTDQFVTWITIVGSAVGILAVFGRGIKEWLTSRFTKRHQEATVDVEKAKVQVTEKEAGTHHLAVIFEGMTAAIEAATKRAEAAEKIAESAQISAASAHGRVDTFQARLRSLERTNDELIDHIELLEAGYPFPPGPPARPIWHSVDE